MTCVPPNRMRQDGDVIMRFGAYEVDLARVEIRRSGQLVDVQPQVFSVIEYLMINRDRVVTKEELLDNIWGDRFVSESTLTSRVKAVRQALGDDGTAQQVVRTVHGRGYRFIAETVDDRHLGSEPSSGRSEWAVSRHEHTSAGAPPDHDHGRGRVHGDDDTSWPFTGRRDHLHAIERWFESGTTGGVLVHGPAGVGTTRLAMEAQRAARAVGTPTGTIIGTAATAAIPLAALGHLLDDVPDLTIGEDDFSHAAAFRRVRQAIVGLGGAHRCFLVVDGVADLDATTVAVLQSVMADMSAFCVIAVSDGGRAASSPFGAQVSAGHVQSVALEGLTESEIDVLLYRTLPGPIDAATLSRLTAVSQQRPGLLRDIVEASILGGTLIDDHGVWRLAGAPTSSAASEWDPGLLSDPARRAAEQLALLPQMPQEMARRLLGDAALEELDAARLIELHRDRSTADVSWRLSLSDPLLATRVIDGLPTLRAHDLRTALAAEVADGAPDVPMFAAVVGWGSSFAEDIDEHTMVASAQHALFEGDFDSAGVLIDALPADTNDSHIAVLRGELALRRGQWAVAERSFGAADVDEADGRTRSHVLRRRASISFYAGARHTETIESLDADAERIGGRVAEALTARRAAMLAYLGMADEVLEATNAFEEHDGITALEMLMAHATGLLLHGRTTEALEVLARVDRRIDSLPDVWVDELSDGLLATRSAALLSHGDVVIASRLVRQHLPVGRRSMFGMLPSLAALVELRAGRPRAALEVVRPVIESSHRNDFPQYRTIARAIDLLIRSSLTDEPIPSWELSEVLDDAQNLTGELRWLTLLSLATILPSLDRHTDAGPMLDEVVAATRSAGARIREAEALALSLVLDVSSDPAAALTRLDALTATFDGEFWPIRAAHARCVARRDAAGLDLVEQAYVDLGYVGMVAGHSAGELTDR